MRITRKTVPYEKIMAGGVFYEPIAKEYMMKLDGDYTADTTNDHGNSINLRTGILEDVPERREVEQLDGVFLID